MSGKSSLPSVRFMFWSASLLPVVLLFLALGPREFSNLIRNLCTVDNKVTPSEIVKVDDNFAVIDNLYIHHGTPYIVLSPSTPLDDPVLSSIVRHAAECRPASETSPTTTCTLKQGALQVVTLGEAREMWGWFVHKIPGVAFITTPSSLSKPTTHALTSVLSGLWSAYSSVPSSPSLPRKLLLPTVEEVEEIENLKFQMNGTKFLSVETKKKWSEWAEENDPRRIERGVIALGDA